MADKQILRSIREGGKTYSPGMEGELEKTLSADQLSRLTERGAISGAFKGVKTESQATSSAFPEDYPGYEVLGQVEGLTPDSVAAMSDEDLLEIKGIGQATLKQIRAYGK